MLPLVLVLDTGSCTLDSHIITKRNLDNNATNCKDDTRAMAVLSEFNRMAVICLVFVWIPSDQQTRTEVWCPDHLNNKQG